MTDQQPAIRLTGLTKEFGAVTAVDHVDLEVRDGEFFSLLGPSGSGKTTMLRMIAGFELPDEGVIELAGRDVTRVPPFDRDVNTVFQDYALFPHMTVAENVEYGLRIRKVPRRERRERVDEALTSDRPYRPALSVEQAVGELRRDAGPRLDRAATEALVATLASQAAA